MLCVCLALPSHAQRPAPPAAAPTTKPSEKPDDNPVTAPEAPANIELLETRIRFEPNGDSRKEVHTRVHINNELGVRQFAHIGFNYNRSYEQIEISAVHITHATGGTADILPSATTDQPNPAVVEASAYQDVRIKSVRILGLTPGDTLEYRVVTTISHHPLAPDFWIDHTFNRGGLVTQELFELAIPPSRKVRLYVSSATPAAKTDETENTAAGMLMTYRWQISSNSKLEHAGDTAPSEPDIVVTTYESWRQLCKSHLALFFGTTMLAPPEIQAKASALAPANATPQARIEAIYDFVSQKIKTIDLPLGATGFRTRNPVEILSSGYASPEDKFALFASLVHSPISVAGFISYGKLKDTAEFARPTAFDHLLTMINLPAAVRWMDLGVGVAPFGVISSQFRGQRALLIRPADEPWQTIPRTLPFAATQKVNVAASLAPDGTLTAKVRYAMRGDNELLLRLAFHESPREKWKDVAQLLALSDGFRGKITSASASDPYATKHAFTVEYEITQPKFVDWKQKPLRIPALLPALGLPDPPEKPDAHESSSPIDLGTPLNVDTRLTLRLPPGVSAESPTGTAVERDYATFTSHYAAEGNVVFASRQINFLRRQIPATGTADYNAFLHAVQTDQAQLFTLTHLESVSQPQPPKPAIPATAKP